MFPASAQRPYTKSEVETMQKVGASIQVKDVINIEGKVYAVMPIMTGEVKDAVSKIPRANRHCVARSVMRQMSEDLEKCHRHGYGEPTATR